jgi:ATP-dependent exoDNAse (exonuclease V) alpha subunit
VLVGDPCQLPEIDAGGAFRSLQHRPGASRLLENHRQTQTWEREALTELRAGDTTGRSTPTCNTNASTWRRPTTRRETASRKHAYTAVSRGRHGNDLFVVVADRRSETLHAAEVQPDPLDGLRAAVQRSSAQRSALDELQAGSTSELDRLRRERDLIRARLSDRPPES